MADDFVIHWEIENMSRMGNTYIESPTYIHANVPWKMSARKWTEDDVEYFIAYIDCNDDGVYDLWRVENKSKLVLVNRKNSEMNKYYESIADFTNAKTWCGDGSFIEYAEVMNADKGYIQDDKVLMEARINVTAVHGVKKIVDFDFSQPQNVSDNVILSVENEKFHVSKGYLATQSPFFAALFFTSFKEKKQSKIELKDVTAKEFSEFLQIVFPSNKPVTVNTYKNILVLSDRFQVQFSMDKAELYLIKTKRVPIEKKLLFADQYKLEQLKMLCLSSFGTAEAVKNIQKTPEFKEYSGAMNHLLLERVLTLLK